MLATNLALEFLQNDCASSPKTEYQVPHKTAFLPDPISKDDSKSQTKLENSKSTTMSKQVNFSCPTACISEKFGTDDKVNNDVDELAFAAKEFKKFQHLIEANGNERIFLFLIQSYVVEI